MPLFRRRKETLNERLLREADMLDQRATAEPAPLLPRRAFPLPEPIAVAYEGPRRFREWDAVVTAEAPALRGEAVGFATLPDGTVIVDEEQGDEELAPLADAVEQELEPPYRARGVRNTDTLWSVAAKRIEVAELKAEGSTLDLSVHGGDRSLTVDGIPSAGSIPALERLGEREGSDYYVHAERLDGDLWEVTVSPL